MDELSAKLSEILSVLQEWGILRQVINRAWLIGAVIVFRVIVVRVMGRWNAPRPEDKRRWIVQFKNLSILFLLVGLLGIWMSELRAFALSLVAVAAAFVLSTKELILCVL